MYNITNSLEELIHTLLKYIFHKLVLNDLYGKIKVYYLEIKKNTIKINRQTSGPMYMRGTNPTYSVVERAKDYSKFCVQDALHL